MDVDDESFEERIKDVQEHLSKAAFVSIDLEMTGIHASVPEDRKTENQLEVRYANARIVAQKYGILQVGICCFLECDGGYASHPYNFYLFPRPIYEPPFFHSHRFSLDADAMNFNKIQNFDFSRWARNGITYCNRIVEQELRQADEFFEQFGGGDDPAGVQLAKEVHSHLYTKNKDWSPVGSFQIDSSVLRTAMGVMRTSPLFRDVILEKHSGHLAGSRPPRVFARKKNSYLNGERSNAAQRFDAHIGFRRVWKMICALEVPLIFHNGLFDVLFLFQQLETPLPPTYREFVSLVSSTWPNVQVFDTKLLCECDFAREEIVLESSGLQTVFNAILKHESRKVDIWQHAKYEYNKCPHEAGYDAMCTGIVYRFFDQVAHASVLKARNLLYLWGDYDFSVKESSCGNAKTLKSDTKLSRASRAPSPAEQCARVSPSLVSST